MSDPTEKQIVHDWSTGELVTYEIDAPVTEIGTPEEIAQLTQAINETPSPD
jgi:hypothetical protein